MVHAEDRLVEVARVSDSKRGEGVDQEIDAFFRANYRGLVAAALVICKNLVLAEDVVGYTMHQLAVKMRAGEISHPLAYARKIVVHRCLEEVATRKRVVAHDPADDALAGGQTPDSTGGLVAHEEQEWMVALLGEIKLWAARQPAKRQAAVLALLDGVQPKDLGKALGCTSAAARQNLKMLRDALRGQFRFDPDYQIAGGDEQDGSRARKDAR